MTFWRLQSPVDIDATVLTGHHSHWLGLGALALAILGSTVMLPAARRFHSGPEKQRFYWLLGGATAMGTGIWVMHFMSMLAYHLPFAVSYNKVVTGLSVLPAILASAVCIYCYQVKKFNLQRVTIAAGVLAAGVGAMHYLGMEAMTMPAEVGYRPGAFFLSLLTAFILPWGALAAHIIIRSQWRQQRLWVHICSSLLLGISMYGIHMAAMNATYFIVTDTSVLVGQEIAPYGLIFAVTLAASTLVCLVIGGLFFDRRWSDLTHSLEMSEQRFARLAESSKVAIFTFNANGVLYANPALAEILDFPASAIAAVDLEELLGKSCAQFAREVLLDEANMGTTRQEQFKLRTREGHSRWVYVSVTGERQGGSVIGLASGCDITDQKIAEDNYRTLAYRDTLTQLANRTMFIDRVERHLALLNRKGSTISSCLLLIDMDKFKVINDTLGHAYGDRLLQAVGERLVKTSRSSDTVARLGGDEFVILAEGINDIYDIQVIAQKILDEFRAPVDIGVRQVSVELSIGALPIIPKTYVSSDDVLRDADIAMYRAKKVNGSYWVIFNEELDASARRMRQLQVELKDTIESGNLQFFYQPIIDIAQERVVGFESLARWQRDNGEWVSPGEFIPLAERSGCVSDIGLWALRKAAAQVSEWSKKFNRRDIYISINIAAVSFSDERFYDLLDEVFEKYDLARGQIRIELTERILMENSEMIMPKLDKFIKLGCNLMLDDFGTGYSSLSYLHRLPIKTVKIDRSFIESLERDKQAPAIVKSIVGLAENLNMTVISEGVETLQQSKRLLDLGCQVVQGFLYSKPMPPEMAEKYYEKYNLTGNLVGDDSLAQSFS